MMQKEMIKQFITHEILQGRSEVSISDDTQLLDSGIIDSLGIMKLLLFMEEAFTIRVNEEELIPENFESVDSLLMFLKKKA